MVDAPGPVLDLERHDIEGPAGLLAADAVRPIKMADRVFEVIVVDAGSSLSIYFISQSSFM